MLVDGADEHPVGAQQALGQAQTALHERQPFRVSPRVGAVDVVVVVLPVPGAGVVGGVDVDAVDLTLVEVVEHLEHVVVLAADNRVGPGCRGATGAGVADGKEGRVGRLAEAAYDL